MSEFERFNLADEEALKAKLKDLGLSLPFSNDTSILGDRVEIGKWTLPNRFVVQPMEGIDADPLTSAPSELTFRRYKRFAAGGAGLIWFEAAVVVPEGRSNPRQLMLTKDNLSVWKELTRQTRETALKDWGHEIVLVLQLAHSGRWSKPSGTPEPVLIHHNPGLDKVLGLDESYPLVSDDELEFLKDHFIESSRLAAEAGFDGVEMKAVHGYLTGEMLCAHTRPGRFGGSYENRTRFVRECTESISQVLGSDHFVTARLTMHEPSPYPYGWGVEEKEGSLRMDLSEPLRFARELTELAGMPVFNFSLGYPRSAPYMNRPFNNPVAGAPLPPEHPLEGIVRFQNTGRLLQQELGPVPVVTAALGWLRDFFPQVAAGLVKEGWCQLVGQGRGSFAYPDSVSDILATGRMDRKKCCIACSLCSQIMKDVEGCNGCPVRDGDIYKDELQKGRNAARQKESSS